MAKWQRFSRSPSNPRLQKHPLPMKLQIPPLPLRKPPDVLLLPNRHPHPLQRRPMRHRRNEQPPIPLECDEPAVEQVIDRRRQQQAVLAIETLRIAAVPPGLAVTRAQMLDAFDARDAAASLDLPNVSIDWRSGRPEREILRRG